MWPDSQFAHPVSSYEYPVPIVDFDPDQPPLVKVVFSRSWLAYVVGSLQQLLLQTTWDTTDANVLALAQQRAFDLIFLFGTAIAPETLPVPSAEEGVEQMIRQNPDNLCQLQSSVDGTNWCTFADFSSCFTAAGQAGEGTAQPAPGGGHVSDCIMLFAKSKYLVTTLVSSGDQILMLSSTGAVLANPSLTWNCPDGNEFFGGSCVPGTQTFNSGDPLPSAPHGIPLALIDGIYYDLGAGPITVPGGVSNAPVTLLINSPDLIDSDGSFTICIRVTNNQTVAWTHTIDFTVTSGSFILDPLGAYTAPYIGSWSAGTGWIGTHNTPDPIAGESTVLRIKRALSGSFTITSITVYYNTQFAEDLSARGDSWNGVSVTFPDGTGNQIGVDATGYSGPGTLGIALGTASNPAAATGTVTCMKLVVSGTGSDPF